MGLKRFSKKMIDIRGEKKLFLVFKLILLPLLLFILLGGLLFWSIAFKLLADKVLQYNKVEEVKTNDEAVMIYNIINTKESDISSLGNRVLLADFSPEVLDINKLISSIEQVREDENRISKYVSAVGLDRKTHDYFSFYGYSYEYKDDKSTSDWLLEIHSSASFGDKNFDAQTERFIKLNKIDLEKCGVSSFLAKSGVFFLFCLNSFNKDTSEAIVDYLVFSQNENLNKTLSLVYQGKVALSGTYGKVIERGQDFFERELRVASIEKDKFYIFTNKEIVILEAQDGNLKLSKTVPFYGFSVVKDDNLVKLEKSSLTSLWFVKFNQSPSGRYIHFVSNAGGIIDTIEDKVLEADNSCVKLKDYFKDEHRYSYKNDIIDPFTHGQYKEVGPLYWDEKNNLFVTSQRFSSGGEVCEDGKVYLYMNKDRVRCEIVADLKCKSAM